jgi:hypothetical protein
VGVHALVGGDREHAQLAALLQFVDGGKLDEAQVDVAGDHVGQHIGGVALVRNVYQLGAR